MIDSHCHLADGKFETDLPRVLARAEEAGVSHCVAIGDTIKESEECLAIAKNYEQVFCTIGVHPHKAKEWKKTDAKHLKELAKAHPKVRAIGEIGLDYHYDFSPRDVQRKVFAEQLEIANELKLPVVVHCREAVEDVWKLASEANPKHLVIHCCTEKWKDVERFVEKGWFLSFTGIATYPNAADIRETIAKCPIHQLMIETDAPYLAPIPHRGKRNEPAFVVEVARTVADIKGLELSEIDATTTANTQAFFSLPGA